MVSRLEVPGWNALIPPRLYARETTAPDRYEVFTLSRWDEPSVPEYIDALCNAAARYHGRPEPVPPEDLPCTGTIDEAVRTLPVGTRQKLATRAPQLVEIVENMIPIFDARTTAQTLRFVHVEYGVIPKEDVLDALEQWGADAVRYIVNTPWQLTDPAYGFKWAANAELDDAEVLVSDAMIIGRTFAPVSVITPEHYHAARAIVESLAAAMSGKKARLHDYSYISMPATLVPIIHQLARGKREKAGQPYFQVEIPPDIAN